MKPDRIEQARAIVAQRSEASIVLHMSADDCVTLADYARHLEVQAEAMLREREVDDARLGELLRAERAASDELTSTLLAHVAVLGRVQAFVDLGGELFLSRNPDGGYHLDISDGHTRTLPSFNDVLAVLAATTEGSADDAT